MSWLRAVFPTILEIAQRHKKAYDYSRTAANPKAYTGMWCQNLLLSPLSAALGAQKHRGASPGVSQRLLGGVAHAGVLLHHVADEVFSCG